MATHLPLTLTGVFAPGDNCTALLNLAPDMCHAKSVTAVLTCVRRTLHHDGGGAMSLRAVTVYSGKAVCALAHGPEGARARISISIPADAPGTDPGTLAGEPLPGHRWELSVVTDDGKWEEIVEVYVEPPASQAPPDPNHAWRVTPQDQAAMDSQQRAVEGIERVGMVVVKAVFGAATLWVLYGLARMVFA